MRVRKAGRVGSQTPPRHLRVFTDRTTSQTLKNMHDRPRIPWLPSRMTAKALRQLRARGSLPPTENNQVRRLRARGHKAAHAEPPKKSTPLHTRRATRHKHDSTTTVKVSSVAARAQVVAPGDELDFSGSV